MNLLKETSLAVLVMLAAAPTFAQTPPPADPQRLQETVQGTVRLEQQTQRKRDEWATEEDEMKARYEAAQASIRFLEQRTRSESERAAGVAAHVAELERSLRESVRLRESIQDTLGAVLTRLEASVARSLPFLPEERAARLQELRTLVARPDVNPAEKLRRLLEALQVEAGYAATVEITQQSIDLAGEPLFADVLRIGRLSLFWRTPDGKRVGEYDQAAAAWTELPGKHARAIGRAMEMAGRMRPIELLALPLGRIQP